MLTRVPILLALGASLFASFSSNASYQLKSYSVGPGATNSAASGSFKLQGSAGEQANGTTANSSNTAGNGSIQTEQLSVPPAPTLGNGSNTYYNKLSLTINPGNDIATDITFAVAVSTDNFVTTNYVQADGTLGSSPVYQTYSTWGSSGGTFMTGLTPSTTYKVKVAAKQGLFTNTAYGATTSASTVAPSVTFLVSPNSINIGTLLPGSVTTSSNLTFSFATNAASGGNVYVSGQNAAPGLHSTAETHTIPAFTGNLSSQSEGFGIQATNPSQTSGGPLSVASPFNGSTHNVGAESVTPQSVLVAATPIIGGTANANLQAITTQSTPSGTDYTETLTFIAAASF